MELARIIRVQGNVFKIQGIWFWKYCGYPDFYFVPTLCESISFQFATLNDSVLKQIVNIAILMTLISTKWSMLTM